MERRRMGSYWVSGEGTYRDHEISSARPVAYLDLQSRLSRAHSATVLRQRRGADRAPARAARNGCAASKTRLTTCEAQTAMASSHRAASWIEGQRSPTDVTWALFQHGRSVEPTRYCLAPVLEGLFRRVYPCLSCRRGIRAPSCTRCAITLAWHPGDCCALWQACAS